MPEIPTHNRRIVLASRPQGAPVPENFRLETQPIAQPAAGQVLLRTLWLSLDPYMRGRMSDAPSYAAPVAIGDVMVGGTVARVEASNREDFKPGDLVLSYSGWQDCAISDGKGLTKLPADLAHPSWALGVLGMPGFTAWHGLLKIGEPKAGETVVVAAASGAVGSVVGQIAKIRGAHVVGIAGGEKKCRHVTEELGFDACIDHRAEDFPHLLAASCPKGIDVYYENVGGPVFDAVVPLLNDHARVPVCGVIAQYNGDGTPLSGPDRLPSFIGLVLRKRLRVQGFIIGDHYADEYQDFAQEMGQWVKEGRVKFFEDVVEGLARAPEAFIGLLEGRNHGKLVVRVS
ncbi:NADP-dependent oxidoreductase [Kozakia baliensis]|uniref:NADP-dependent oxidoreductase n=1 Tax=Kozakia baliensis TaxID=153496 RepID=A0A1D8USP5_9PROT|nr:NADP-dependent oxidoreductase [Kozakia baliensis]AOX16658.1 NADP-dependent oxidoreductase [Kozakia baliensis]